MCENSLSIASVSVMQIQGDSFNHYGRQKLKIHSLSSGYLLLFSNSLVIRSELEHLLMLHVALDDLGFAQEKLDFRVFQILHVPGSLIINDNVRL